MYHHAGLETLWFENGKPTWRHGLAPMHYPTHCTAHLISVTGERLTEVSCLGWGDDDPLLKGNPYGNPFWNETAQFRTNRGHALQVQVWWKGAHRGGERARFYGDKMSFFFPDPNGLGAVIVRAGKQTEKDSGGFERTLPGFEPYTVPEWWNTDLLPPSLRHKSGHEGSHTFITHEFVDAVLRQRRPAVDVYEAIAYTAPGLVAHESALKGGERLKIPSFDV
jgi:predicted dehydrogenase